MEFWENRIESIKGVVNELLRCLGFQPNLKRIQVKFQVQKIFSMLLII